jgi:hypothetical protein
MKTGDNITFVICGTCNYCQYDDCFHYNSLLRIALSINKDQSSSSNEH